jgi:hypothetical protein
MIWMSQAAWIGQFRRGALLACARQVLDQDGAVGHRKHPCRLTPADKRRKDILNKLQHKLHSQPGEAVIGCVLMRQGQWLKGKVQKF